MIERTLVLIKPDATRQNIIGKIINKYEENNLIIERCEMVFPDRKLLMEHYREHINKDFFEGLIEFMCEQKIVALIVSGENAVEDARKINGVTDPLKADEGTIRNLYGTDIQKNAVHSSASKEDAAREINIWFGDENEK